MSFEKQVLIDTGDLIAATNNLVTDCVSQEEHDEATMAMMAELGWKSPTEMAIHKQQFETMFRQHAAAALRGDGSSDLVRARIILKVLEIFNIDLTGAEVRETITTHTPIAPALAGAN